MRIDYIIDGYNLMHAAGLAKQRYGPGDLERSRNRLLQKIRHGLSQEQRSRTTVVFDGDDSGYVMSPDFRFHGMLVTFSAPKQEADDVIEQLIAEHSAPKQLVIVSGDHRLHKAARVRRAIAIDSEAFVERLQNYAQPDASVAPTESGKRESAEFDQTDWIETFGEIDVSKIEAELRREDKPPKSLPNPPPDIVRQPLACPPEQDKNSSEEQAELENSEILDLEFWEKRISELDQDAD